MRHNFFFKNWDSVIENQSVISKHLSYIQRSQRENALLS